MLFRDMRPSFVREPNRHRIFGVYSLCHVHVLTVMISLSAYDDAPSSSVAPTP
jgi:hypothetical protein